MYKQVEKNFKKRFLKYDNLMTYFSPGRVNIIGDHVDNFGGTVLPMAIPLGTYGVFRKNEDSIVRVYSEQFSNAGIVEFNMNEEITKGGNWADYVKGVIVALKDLKYDIPYGFDLYVYGTLPPNSGLSSSASLELLVVCAISDMFNLGISSLNTAIYAKKAENDFIGVKCGIMDQFSIAMGKKGYALHINTETLDCDYIPMDIDGISVLIINSNKERKLQNSLYNRRLEECNIAFEFLCEKYDIRKNLCSFSLDEISKLKKSFPSETIYRRTRHVVTENKRVEDFILALYSGEKQKIGNIVNESHESLKNDFEVSCYELDEIVDILRTQEGCLGARMTGAGFGGCVVALVYDEDVEAICNLVKKEYYDKCKINADIFIARSFDGTMRIN